MLPLSRTGDFLPKMSIWTGLLNNSVLSYSIWHYNVLARATVLQHAQFYQYHMKNVLMRHLGHGKMQLARLNWEWVHFALQFMSHIGSHWSLIAIWLKDSVWIPNTVQIDRPRTDWMLTLWQPFVTDRRHAYSLKGWYFQKFLFFEYQYQFE